METTIAVFNQISLRIIREQENIIGSLAWDEAAKVPGLSVIDRKAGELTVTGDPKVVVNALIARYEKLFGRLSREVSKEAVGDLTAEIPASELPESLQ